LTALLQQEGYTVVQSRWVDPDGNVIWNGLPAGQVGTPTADGATPPNITDPGSTTSEAPTKAKIIADLQSLASIVGPNDLVVVYFSGHGMMDTLNPPSAHQWIIPYKGVLRFPDTYYYGYPDTSIRDDELGVYLNPLPTNRKVVILDTCNSGGFIGNRLEADALPPVFTGSAPRVTANLIAAAIAGYSAFSSSPTGISPRNATVISAAGRDELSYEAGGQYKHGIMTYFLLLTAESADLNRDGHVTTLESYAFVKAGIDEYWNANPDVIANGQTFAPRISGGPVDFVLF
jgi:hypothetical protein